ncbi:hypothetical protein RI129_006413 [Pyrocoelia pectoralis]|uniref:Short-chain dehydrogenase/reductase 3 n=1 Tax=Pyrocoelia pectoralis TaxID=417401 RepID=A0AAN7ZNQ4_9COLE
MNHTTETTENNCKRGKVMSVLSLIVEIHGMILAIIWEILVATYRSLIPIPKKPVKGEVVLVTGAGNGLGREIALLYASKGATAVCLDIDEEHNKETVEIAKNLGYCKAYHYTCDVTDCAKVHAVVDRIKEEVGEVTILINNAGIMPTRLFHEQTKEQIEQTFNVNLLGYHWTIKAILPSMLKDKRGHIVSISSLCGFEGMPHLVPYCSSKFGVRGLMSSLRRELDFHEQFYIKTTALYPYYMDTGLLKKPNIRFPTLMPILKPSDVAKCVMECQRRDVLERMIPKEFAILHKIITVLPHEAEKIFVKFFNTYLESD